MPHKDQVTVNLSLTMNTSSKNVEKLLDNLKEIMRESRAEVKYDESRETEILNYIAKRPGCSTKEIAGTKVASNSDPKYSLTCRILQKLEKKNLIRRDKLKWAKWYLNDGKKTRTLKLPVKEIKTRKHPGGKPFGSSPNRTRILKYLEEHPEGCHNFALCNALKLNKGIVGSALFDFKGRGMAHKENEKWYLGPAPAKPGEPPAAAEAKAKAEAEQPLASVTVTL